MKKKVGILTLYNNNYNYGGILQAYALNKIINDLGYDCKTISYQEGKNSIYPNKIVQLEQYNKKEALKKILEKFFAKISSKKFKKIYLKRKKLIDDFKLNYIRHTEVMNDEVLKINYRKFDYIISGSDQVWNPNTVTFGYLQQFEHKNIKKISYAASISRNALSQRDRSVIIPAINDFDFISVREETAKSLIKNEIDKNIYVTIDPTLLLGKDNWKNITNNEKIIKDEYVLCYFFSNSIKYRKIIKKFCTKNNLRLIYIPFAKQQYNRFDLKGEGETIENVSPQVFVNLVMNSKYVITDSFHGAAFSIIFEKNFLVVDREKNTKVSMNSRLHDLLKKLDIMDRLVIPNENMFKILENNINYDKLEKLLEEYKKQSIDFLKMALEPYNKEKNNDEIVNQQMCLGCQACFNICPKNAIEMIENHEGFLYPKINHEKCIDCGKCRTVCPAISNNMLDKTPIAYAMYNKNEKIRLNSSSGGVFSLLAEYILDKNGIVFGASYDDKFNVKHIAINNKSDLIKLTSSKYIQSSIGESYKLCKKILDNNNLVLFTGTPCQINGLKNFLMKEYPNLYTQDIICHGVPSPLILKKYILYLENKIGEKTSKINFRCKDNGWNKYALKINYTNNKVYKKNHSTDKYMQTFLSDSCLRKSCYYCSAKDQNRSADITLGDFWGINYIDKNMNDNKGTSLVLINTRKGEELLNYIKNNTKYVNVNFEEAIKYNTSYYKSAKMSKNREKLILEAKDKNFNIVYKKYIKKPIHKRILIQIKNIIKEFI